MPFNSFLSQTLKKEQCVFYGKQPISNHGFVAHLKSKNGEMQSPIDLMHERVQVVSHLERLKRSYKPSNATLKNRGHDIMLKWVDDAGSINVNGTDYELKQCHWHSPSKHTINGRRKIKDQSDRKVVMDNDPVKGR